MLSRLCIEQRIPLVNIVRKPDQEAMLRAAGAAYVCDSTSAGFMAELIGALKATGATLAFDAIGGGRLASQILAGMEAAASAAAGGYSRHGSAVQVRRIYPTAAASGRYAARLAFPGVSEPIADYFRVMAIAHARATSRVTP